jgi:hypothetical protein
MRGESERKFADECLGVYSCGICGGLRMLMLMRRVVGCRLGREGGLGDVGRVDWDDIEALWRS